MRFRRGPDGERRVGVATRGSFRCLSDTRPTTTRDSTMPDSVTSGSQRTERLAGDWDDERAVDDDDADASSSGPDGRRRGYRAAERSAGSAARRRRRRGGGWPRPPSISPATTTTRRAPPFAPSRATRPRTTASRTPRTPTRRPRGRRRAWPVTRRPRSSARPPRGCRRMLAPRARAPSRGRRPSRARLRAARGTSARPRIAPEGLIPPFVRRRSRSWTAQPASREGGTEIWEPRPECDHDTRGAHLGRYDEPRVDLLGLVEAPKRASTPTSRGRPGPLLRDLIHDGRRGGRRCPREDGARDDYGAHWLPMIWFSPSLSVFWNARPRPQVVITRIAVRHDHHLAPNLVERRSRRRQGRARRRPPPQPRRQRRTSRGRPRGRRRVRGSRRKMSTIWRPNSAGSRQRRRDGGIGERRGGRMRRKGTKRKRALPRRGHASTG